MSNHDIVNALVICGIQSRDRTLITRTDARWDSSEIIPANKVRKSRLDELFLVNVQANSIQVEFLGHTAEFVRPTLVCISKSYGNCNFAGSPQFGTSSGTKKALFFVARN